MRLILPPPIQALIAGLGMWGVAALIPMGVIFPGQTLLGWTMMAGGLGIDLLSGALFFKAKTTVSPFEPQKTTKLVTDGLYQISRNPMYLGLASILTGWALLLGNPLNALMVAGFVFAITGTQIKPEEEALRKKFGADYDAYSEKVRRWL